MAARANWKGYLRLNLVTCAVGLYPAVETTSRLKCHTLNRKTGNRIREEVLDSVTGEPVPREERVRGCEVAKNEYVMLEDDELAAIKLESNQTINLEGFVERAEIDERYFDRPYYLVPEDRVSREAYAVIRDAMAEKDVAGIGRLVYFRRERVVLLRTFEKGILATFLRFGSEVRSPASAFAEIADFDAPKEMRSLAAELIERARSRFDPSQFTDRYEDAMIALVQAKDAARKGVKGAKVPKAAEAPAPSNVVSLMDALRRSIAAEKGSSKEAAKAPAQRSKSGGRNAGRPAARKTSSGRSPSRRAG